MGLETLVLSFLASYGVYRKANDLFIKYKDYCISNPYLKNSQSNLHSISTTVKYAGIGVASAILSSASFSLLYFGLYYYFSN
jgi:hypothetical protein